MEDGDAQYLRETGIAHLLHAASLQASSEDPKRARNLFAGLVEPSGDLRLPLALVKDALANATKIHPDLFLRFARGAVDDTCMTGPHDPAPLNPRGRGSALTECLEAAADAAVARSADEAAGVVLGESSPVFATAVCDIARGCRALSGLRLSGVPPVVAPPKTGDPAPIDPSTLQKRIQLHVDVVLPLPLCAVEPPSACVEMLSDATKQLRWLLNKTALAAQEVVEVAPPTYTFSLACAPTFHLHACMPPPRAELSAEEHRMLCDSVNRAVVHSAVADDVTVRAPTITDAVTSVLAFSAPADTTCRIVVATAADVRGFHLGQIGESLAACIATHAASATVNGETELGAHVTAMQPVSAAKAPPAAARTKGAKGAAPSMSVSNQAAGSAVPPGAVENKGTVAFLGIARPGQRPVTTTSTELFVNRVASLWFAGHLKSVAGVSTGAATELSVNSSETETHGASEARLGELDVARLPSVCMPFAAFASLAPATSPQGAVDPTVRAESILRASGVLPAPPKASAMEASAAVGPPQPVVLASVGTLFTLALGVSRALRCSPQPFLVTRGWCREAVDAHANGGKRLAPVASEVQAALDATLWLATGASEGAASLPEKDIVVEMTAGLLAQPPTVAQWRKEIASIV